MRKLEFGKFDLEIRESANKRIEDNNLFFSANLKKLTDDGGEDKQTIDAASLEEEYYCFEQNEYRNTEFVDVTFGTSAVKNEDGFAKAAGISFKYCDFSMCCFSNIIFTDCSFTGCNFKECFTLEQGVIFKNCSFNKQAPGKNSLGDMPCIFDKTALTVKFIECDISQVVFVKSSFYFSSFEGTNAYDAIFVDCSYEIVKIKDSDLRKTKIVNPKIIEFNIEDTYKSTLVDSNTYLGKINFNKNEKREVKYAAELYIAFSELFENNKLPYHNGEYFFLYKKTEYHLLDSLEKFKSLLGFATCGYGERPSYSLISSIFVVLFFGTMYMLFGVNGSDGFICFTPSLSAPFPPLDNLLTWYHFSLVTFTTVGYGNVVPVGWSLVFSAFEMVSGVIMVGLWVSTLVRKMTR